jgi:ankyrin repeat protein
MAAEASALHAAVERGSEEDVRDILSKSQVVIDARDSDGLTPFALACRERHVGYVARKIEMI